MKKQFFKHLRAMLNSAMLHFSKFCFAGEHLRSLMVGFLKRAVFLLPVFLLLSLFTVSVFPADSLPASIVVVMKNRNYPQINSVYKGFQQALAADGIEGTFSVITIEEKELVKRIKALKPDLILTVGTSPTELLVGKTGDIPIVFCMVMESPVCPMSGAPFDMSGVVLAVPVELQLAYLQRVVPNLKKVGVIYTPAQNGLYIEKARKTANAMSIDLKTYPINSHKEIPKLKDMGVDALWLIPDTVVCHVSIIKRMLLSGVRNRIPIMGIGGNYVRAGALLGMEGDLEDNGRQAGEVAARILRGDTVAKELVLNPRKVKLYLNKTVADHMGIKFPEEIINNAYKVYGVNGK